MRALLVDCGGVVFGVRGDGEGAEGVVGLGGHGVVGCEMSGEVVDVVLGRCQYGFGFLGMCSVWKGQIGQGGYGQVNKGFLRVMQRSRLRYNSASH